MKVEKMTVDIKPDVRRVVLLYFNAGGASRIRKIIKRVESLSEERAEEKLNEVVNEFGGRHRDFIALADKHFAEAQKTGGISIPLTNVKRRLAGTYFSKEYSVEASALFNPSIVIHPDQSGVEDGSVRFLASVRATGEGHISSIGFRSGIIDSECKVTIDPVSRSCILPELDYQGGDQYNCKFNENSLVSERVLFPFLPFESMGMEDMRLVRFEDDKSYNYYGLYTAYNGREIRQQLLKTADFRNFTIKPLRGEAVQDKGISLFPRKIRGKYVMSSRQDGENLYIMTSDDLEHWKSKTLQREPEFDWEFVQLGNCGSPIETDKGWILFTHAVGPCRKYVMSALLLDLNEPSKIIGRLNKPLLSPEGDEREGYVPNVVYSCGAMTHRGNIIIPYAQSDTRCSFAKVDTKELLAEFR